MQNNDGQNNGILSTNYFAKNYHLPIELVLHTSPYKLLINQRQFVEGQQKFQKKIAEQINRVNQSQAYSSILPLIKYSSEIAISFVIMVYVDGQNCEELNKTIESVKANIKQMKKTGYTAYQFVCIVFFDGFQRMETSELGSKNILTFFNELQSRNSFQKIFSQNYQQNQKLNNDQDLFSELEVERLNNYSFKRVHQFYVRIKEVKEFCEGYFRKSSFGISNTNINFPNEIFGLICKKMKNQLLKKEIKEIDFEQMDDQNLFILAKQYIEQQKVDSIILNSISKYYKEIIKLIKTRESSFLMYPSIIPTSHSLNSSTAFKLGQPNENQQRNQFFLLACPIFEHKGRAQVIKIFFKGFCQFIQPQYVFFLKANVQCEANSFLNMWNTVQNIYKNDYSVVIPQISIYRGIEMIQKIQQQQSTFSFINHIFSIQQANIFYNRFKLKSFNLINGLTNVFTTIPLEFSLFKFQSLKMLNQNQQNYQRMLGLNSLENGRLHLYEVNAKCKIQCQQQLSSIFQEHALQIQNESLILDDENWQKKQNISCKITINRFFWRILFVFKYLGLAIFFIFYNLITYFNICPQSDGCVPKYQQSTYQAYLNYVHHVNITTFLNIFFGTNILLNILLGLMSSGNTLADMADKRYLLMLLQGIFVIWSIVLTIFTFISWNEQQEFRIYVNIVYGCIGIIVLSCIIFIKTLNLKKIIDLFASFIFYSSTYIYGFRIFAYTQLKGGKSGKIEKLSKLFYYLLINFIIGFSYQSTFLLVQKKVKYYMLVCFFMFISLEFIFLLIINFTFTSQKLIKDLCNQTNPQAMAQRYQKGLEIKNLIKRYGKEYYFGGGIMQNEQNVSYLARELGMGMNMMTNNRGVSINQSPQIHNRFHSPQSKEHFPLHQVIQQNH